LTEDEFVAMKHEREAELIRGEWATIRANTANAFERRDEIFTEYAVALDKAAGDLTREERQQAMLNWTLEHALD